jgi:hypothetical protein
MRVARFEGNVGVYREGSTMFSRVLPPAFFISGSESTCIHWSIPMYQTPRRNNTRILQPHMSAVYDHCLRRRKTTQLYATHDLHVDTSGRI